MEFRLNDRQRELVELAGRLGRDKFAPRAAEIDREARFPFENYADMREAGLLALCVPKEYGGMGADYETYCLVAAEIGRHCGATALTLNMHSCAMMWSGDLVDALPLTAEQRARHHAHRGRHYERVVRDGAIYAQPFSEGNAAASGRAAFETTAVKVDGGWLINGRKVFASLSGAANYYGLLCTEEKPGKDHDRRDTMYIVAPADAPGVSVVGDWDPLGMRGTVSRTLILKDVFVPEDEELMPPGVYHTAALSWPHMFMTMTPTYMGVAQAAVDFTRNYLRGEVPGMPPIKRRNIVAKQLAFGEMQIKLEQASALFRRAISEASYQPSKEQRLRAYATQYTVMEFANDICRLAIRTCGGHSMLKSLPLERLYRDSRCGALMLPWTAEICIERVGRESLYEAGETD
ncbi:MAG: acyl-CoA/acyl-ACP dehydrogenase [Alphaproteobacteria bacterium]|jgi:alkylation response protein AidB-like acyl-CoA dehydrogenase|nr:acyl-CoA/acyl-ACP dehydrogenase [Alphaproteobacteria bacterium]